MIGIGKRLDVSKLSKHASNISYVLFVEVFLFISNHNAPAYFLFDAVLRYALESR